MSPPPNAITFKIRASTSEFEGMDMKSIHNTSLFFSLRLLLQTCFLNRAGHDYILGICLYNLKNGPVEITLTYTLLMSYCINANRVNWKNYRVYQNP